MTNGRMSEVEWHEYKYHEIVDDLRDSIAKIHALTEVVLKSSIDHTTSGVMQNCWSIIQEQIVSAQSLCEELHDKYKL